MSQQKDPGKKALWFFLLTFGLSWMFWVPAVLIKSDIMSSPWAILLYLGGLGPAAAALILLYSWEGEGLRKAYWSRVFDPKRISGPWYLVIFLSYPALSLLTTFLLQGQVQLTETFQDVLSQPLRLIPFVVFLYLFGPFPEELGWRGYALDRLQRVLDPASSSILLGFCHAIWHVPLFLMAGTSQAGLGFGTAEFWIFMGSATVVSVFYTWIYNHNQNSILSASLFHFSINLTGNVFFETQTIRLVRLLVLTALALGLILITAPKGTLGYQSGSAQPDPEPEPER